MNTNESAFPFIFHDGAENQWSEPGLTKREYFAAMAMQGLLSNGDRGGVYVSREAIQYADELLKQLEQ